MESSQDPVANVTVTVVRNLEDQHDWKEVKIRHIPGNRPLIRGLPPRRLYTHPDDQIAALEHEHKTGERLFQDAEHEWVLAVQISEKWTLGNFAEIFDSIEKDSGSRGKRIVLATVHNDSTVVYYLMHEGMVKPRQN